MQLIIIMLPLLLLTGITFMKDYLTQFNKESVLVNNKVVVFDRGKISKLVINDANTYISQNLKDCSQLKKGIENMGDGTSGGFSKNLTDGGYWFSGVDFSGGNGFTVILFGYRTFGSIHSFNINSNCQIDSLKLYFKDANYSTENEKHNQNIIKNSLEHLKILFNNVYALGVVSKKGDINDFQEKHFKWN